MDIDKQIMTLEPKNITFGKRDFSEIQENILTCVSDAVQKHVSKEKRLDTDLFNQPIVTILADEASPNNNKRFIKKEVEKLQDAKFTMRWVNPQTHRTTETKGVIITTFHDVIGTNKIELTLNVWALPFLLYYGTGVGGTRFNKYFALRIKGKYSKRIYKMLSSRKDKGGVFSYPIEQLKKDFCLADDFSNSRLKQAILEPAKKELEAQNVDVWFDYELKATKRQHGRKPKADTVLFFIKVKHPKEVGGDMYKKYLFVYNAINLAFKYTGDTAQRSADKIHELGKLDLFFHRLKHYEHELRTDVKSLEHVNNSLKKMLREETGISK